MREIEGVQPGTLDADTCAGTEVGPLPPASEAQIEFVRETLQGRRCPECGEPIEPPAPCDACAEKRELLRQVFPRLHGDS